MREFAAWLVVNSHDSVVRLRYGEINPAITLYVWAQQTSIRAEVAKSIHDEPDMPPQMTLKYGV